MKLLFTIFALMTLENTYAQEVTRLKESDIGLSGAKAKIITVKKICPEGSECLAYGSDVHIRVALNGCADSFGGSFSSFKAEGRIGVLSFGAININNKHSDMSLCPGGKFKNVVVRIPFEGKVVLESMEYKASKSFNK